DVDQVYRAVGDQPVQVGAGAEPELAADFRGLLRRAAEYDHLVHVGPLGVNSAMSLAEPGPEQGDLHGSQHLPAAPGKMTGRSATTLGGWSDSPSPVHAASLGRPGDVVTETGSSRLSWHSAAGGRG